MCWKWSRFWEGGEQLLVSVSLFCFLVGNLLFWAVPSNTKSAHRWGKSSFFLSSSTLSHWAASNPWESCSKLRCARDFCGVWTNPRCPAPVCPFLLPCQGGGISVQLRRLQPPSCPPLPHNAARGPGRCRTAYSCWGQTAAGRSGLTGAWVHW